MSSLKLPLLVCWVLSLGGPVALAEDDVSEKEIKTALASPDSTLRYNTWKRLNPEKDAHYRTLVQILKTLSWYDRQGAVLALAKAATDATLKKMTKDLKESKDLAVRQGMADALAKMNDEKFYPYLYGALGDKDPAVRRMVVYYLRVHKKKDAVESLVNLFQKEEDPVVKSFIIESLNSLTQAFQGPNPAAWFTWWEQAKADKDYQLGKIDEQSLKKAEELGNRLKKRTTVSMAGGVTLETEERGNTKLNSVPILIIPYYNYSKKTMMPFLSELERTNKLFYIDLPPIGSFKDLQVVSDAKIPFYPIDKLVAAFEDLRKQTGQERFAIMACGMNCWIAMRYAQLYPRSVSHMVFVCPLSSNKAYGDATQRMETQGKGKNDLELWHFALTRSFNSKTGESTHDAFHKEKKIATPEGEDGGIDRRAWSLFFKDERDSLIGMLYPVKDYHMGSVAIPDYRCFAEPPKARIPTIVIAGRHSLYSSVDDCKAIAKHFGGQLYIYDNSSCMPFAEESTLFNKHMAFLLREKAPAKAKAKPKEKEKEKEKGEDANAAEKGAEKPESKESGKEE